MIFSLILIFAISFGNLIKPSLFGHSLGTVLDFTVVLLCLVLLFYVRFKLTKPPSFIIFGLFFALIALISLIFSPLKLSLNDFLYSLIYTVRFTAYILFGWLMLTGKLLLLRKNIPGVLYLSGIILAVSGLLQFVFLPDGRFLAMSGWDPHYFRTFSTLLDPNFLGGFFVLTLLLIFQHLKTSKKWFFFFALVYLVLITTFSRSSYLMFLVSFLTLAAVRRSVKIAVSAVFLFSICLLVFQVYIRAVNQIIVLDRIQTASLRLATWQQGLEIFWRNPVLGAGFGSYQMAIKTYNLGTKEFLESHGSTTNDSSLLYVAATTGIVGLFMYALFLISLVKVQQSKKQILVPAILGLMVHSVFVNSLFYPFILIWTVLMATDSYAQNSR